MILKSQSVNLSEIQSKLMANVRKAAASGKITDQKPDWNVCPYRDGKIDQGNKAMKEMKETTLKMKLKKVKSIKRSRAMMPENNYTFEMQIEDFS